MRTVIFVRANAETEAAASPDPEPAVLAEMAIHHEELARAGVLLDGTGLHPSRSGWRVHDGGDGVRVVDGPFAEAKELIAGWTLIQVRSRAQAMEASRRFPNPMGRGPWPQASLIAHPPMITSLLVNLPVAAARAATQRLLADCHPWGVFRTDAAAARSQAAG